MQRRSKATSLRDKPHTGIRHCIAALAAGLLAAVLLGLLSAGNSLAQSAARLSKQYKPPPALPLTKFYDTPVPFTAGRAGELIRSEPFDDYALPLEVSAVRILYHSRSAAGTDVAVSGVVLIPEGRPPAGGWPVIAWAHGFSGVARQCAPSLMRNVYYGPFLSMYVGLGYAVVATDYAGLGTNFRHAAMDMQSNATDVINSIPAACAALPQLGARWLALGDSEGGLAAAAVAELENQSGDSNYLGSVSVSGIASEREIYAHLAQESSGNKLAALAYGINTIYPQCKVEDILTEKALALYKQMDDSCDAASGSLRFSATEMLKSSWLQNEFVDKFFSRNAVGDKPAGAPLLVLTGGMDPDLSRATGDAMARLCKQKDRVLYYNYPDLDPQSLLEASVREQITWIQARFAGKSAPRNCP
jgi:hypothetical protein